MPRKNHDTPTTDPAYEQAREEILRAAEWKVGVIALEGMGLTAVPPEIGECKHLETLHVNDNRLTTLPPEIRNCDQLRELYLHGNPALRLPPEVLGPMWKECNDNCKPASPDAILDYYFSQRAGGDRPLNEVRLMLVGRGGTGKTSLVERLVRNKFRANQKETLGVELSDWRLRGCRNGNVLAHVWDFAGQTITHAMHQFFLSSRTVYVLALTGRENSERDDADYWLQLIAAFGLDADGKGPPVIIALNKRDDPCSGRVRVDRNALRERYPFIAAFVETDCKTNTGIVKLKKLLCAIVDDLPWVRASFPNTYRRVKERLEATGDPHLPYDKFRSICRECGLVPEERQDLLAENLHALGVALNFRKDPRLHFACVLKPHWLTENVYILVRHAAKKAGVLQRSALPSVLAHEKDSALRLFLVDLMVRFELAYPLADDSTAPVNWLVPQALPDSQPEGMEVFGNAKTEDATRLLYTYSALPVSIVPRFIVRTHPFIEGDLRWASGVVLTLNGARALVRAGYKQKQVEVTAIGPAEARRELAGLAQREIRFINEQIRGLNPLEETETDEEWIRVKTLEEDEQAGHRTGVPTATGTVLVDPAKKLNKFSAPEARDASWKPRIFISYSHEDEDQRRKLELYLKVLATHGLLHEKWDDRKIQAGEDWDQTINAELEAADVVLLLLSTDALASDYIQAVEMRRALERAAVRKVVLVPIILEDCQWRLPELKKLQALPSKAKPVREWVPQSKGWSSVSEGLMALFKRLRQEHEARRDAGLVATTRLAT